MRSINRDIILLLSITQEALEEKHSNMSNSIEHKTFNKRANISSYTFYCRVSVFVQRTTREIYPQTVVLCPGCAGCASLDRRIIADSRSTRAKTRESCVRNTLRTKHNEPSAKHHAQRLVRIRCVRAFIDTSAVFFCCSSERGCGDKYIGPARAVQLVRACSDSGYLHLNMVRR